MQITRNAGRIEIAKLIDTQADKAPAEAMRKTAANQPAHTIRQSEIPRQVKLELNRLPDVDWAKVSEIKTALAEGRICFDADKLAELIACYHGGNR